MLGAQLKWIGLALAGAVTACMAESFVIANRADRGRISYDNRGFINVMRESLYINCLVWSTFDRLELPYPNWAASKLDLSTNGFNGTIFRIPDWKTNSGGCLLFSGSNALSIADTAIADFRGKSGLTVFMHETVTYSGSGQKALYSLGNQPAANLLSCTGYMSYGRLTKSGSSRTLAHYDYNASGPALCSVVMAGKAIAAPDPWTIFLFSKSTNDNTTAALWNTNAPPSSYSTLTGYTNFVFQYDLHQDYPIFGVQNTNAITVAWQGYMDNIMVFDRAVSDDEKINLISMGRLVLGVDTP